MVVSALVLACPPPSIAYLASRYDPEGWARAQRATEAERRAAAQHEQEQKERAAARLALLAKAVKAEEGSPRQEASDETTGKVLEATEFLKTLPEVAYYFVKRNNVYVALNQHPAKTAVTLRAAALKANKALGLGAHVYVLGAKAFQGFTEDGPSMDYYVCHVTYRHEVLEKDTCVPSNGKLGYTGWR